MKRKIILFFSRLVAVTLLGLILVSCGYLPFAPYWMGKIVEQNLPSAFQIEVVRNDGRQTQGSGFFISENGVGVSNFHVFKNAKSATILLEDSSQYSISAVLAFSPEEDLIIFCVDSVQTHAVQFPEELFEPRKGQEIIVISSPLQYTNSVSAGIISGFSSDEEGEKIQISAPISDGSSGGMVLNKHGAVIGIAQSYNWKGQNLNFAIPWHKITGLYYQQKRMDLPQKYLREVRAKAKQYYAHGENFLQAGKTMLAQEKFEYAIGTDPSFAKGYFGLGCALKEQKDTVLALSYLAKSEEIYLQNRQPSTAPEFFFCGEIAWEKAEIAKAEKCFQQSVFLRPDHAPTHRYLGMLALFNEQFELAEWEFQQAIKYDVRNIDHYFLLAGLYLQLERTESAENVFHRLNEIDADAADVLWRTIHP